MVKQITDTRNSAGIGQCLLGALLLLHVVYAQLVSVKH